MDYKIRKIKEAEYSVLGDFLYEAIFIPEGVKSPPREIIEQPELQVYISDFGKHKGDCCLVAELDKRIIGAVRMSDLRSSEKMRKSTSWRIGFEWQLLFGNEVWR